MALGIPGLRVGVWTSELSGCTVVLPPEGTLGGIAVRGAGPSTVQAALLGPNGKEIACHGVVLSGGSAFGLAAADGVVRWLEEHGVGYAVGPDDRPLARVPIVGGAILLDGSVAGPDGRPDAVAGRAACDAATEDDPPEGSHGAGRGCMVAKVGGLEHAWRGGQGVSVQRAGEVVVGAVVANNAVGEVLDEDGTVIAGTRAPDGTARFPYEVERPSGARDAPTGNTVIGCVVTNARLTKSQAVRVADLANSGVVRAVRPAHTHFDGDAMFCLSTQRVETYIDLVAALAADAVADACRRGVRAAISYGGVPGMAGTGAGGT